MKTLIRIAAAAVALAAAVLPAGAEVGAGIYDDFFREEWRLDTVGVGELRLDVGSTLFFRNNEFSTPALRGYTLPGFRLRPSVSYRPVPAVKIEAGLYALRFWGTDDYPNLAYQGVAPWMGYEKANRGFHLLPFLRVQFAAKGWNFILGSLYGGASHRLVEAIYAPELNLTADPEAGAQILYSNRWLDFDIWANWQSFIYRHDTHQEAFVFGLSSALKYLRPENPLQLYTPLQLLYQHHGGEIDDVENAPVETLLNAAAGLGASYRFPGRILRRVSAEADLLAYVQQCGSWQPFDNGLGCYAKAEADVYGVRVKGSWHTSSRFANLYGYPFYGNVSVSGNGTFRRSSTAGLGLAYEYEFALGYRLGADVDLYFHSATLEPRLGSADPETVPSSCIPRGDSGHIAPERRTGTSFCAGLYFRIDPSFLLKRF